MRCLVPLLSVLSGIAIVPSASGQAAAGPPRAVASTWEIRRDATGQEVSRTLVNRRLDFGFRYIATKPTDLLFVQEVRTTVTRGQEGDNGRVSVQAWADRARAGRYPALLWRVEADGSRVEVLPEHLDVTQLGCCGTADTHTYYSLSTGRAVASFTDGPMYFEGGDTGPASSQGRFWIAFLNANGTIESPGMKANPNGVGELVFVEGDSVRARVVITAANSHYVGAPTPEVALVSSDGRVTRAGLTVGQGQSAVVRFAWEDGPTIDIPIRGKGFGLSTARVPQGFSLKAVR